VNNKSFFDLFLNAAIWMQTNINTSCSLGQTASPHHYLNEG